MYNTEERRKGRKEGRGGGYAMPGRDVSSVWSTEMLMLKLKLMLMLLNQDEQRIYKGCAK